MEEEEKARALEQEIADMQYEDPPSTASWGGLQLKHLPPRGLAQMQVAFQGLNYLHERSPLSEQLQATP